MPEPRPVARRRVSAFGLLLAFVLVVGGTDLFAAGNLLLNSDLGKGAGNSPDHWRSEGWDQRPEVTSYTWIQRSGGPGELQVNSLKPNDARWMQNLNLAPGWYYFSAKVRTEAVGLNATGASLSILEDGIMSPDLRGTNDGRELGFYLKVGARGGDLEVACRLGGFGNVNTGRAFFRDVSVVAVTAPSAGTPQFDLDAIRKQSAEAPIGSPWTLAVTFILLGIIAVFGWKAFGAPMPEATVSKAPQRERPKKAARR